MTTHDNQTTEKFTERPNWSLWLLALIPAAPWGIMGYTEIGAIVLLATCAGLALWCVNRRYILSAAEMTVRSGIIGSDYNSQRLARIESIQVKRGLWGMIFGCGTVTLIGTGGTQTKLRFISNPYQVRTEIQHNIDLLTTAPRLEPKAAYRRRRLVRPGAYSKGLS